MTPILLSTITAATSFAFLLLPFEIRQMIYKALLVPAHDVHVAREAEPHYRHKELSRSHLNILGVSKQIYAEASNVFYGNNTFVFG